MDSTEKGSGRLVGHMHQCLFPPFGPSWIPVVSFWWQPHVTYQDFYCETTHTSGYHCVWPRWAVPVNVSLTDEWVDR